MKYCKNCIMPDTKPDLKFENGLCSACINYAYRSKIDWKQREEEFRELLTNSKGKYTCVVPVSGGKDSHAQVLKVLEMGGNPLAVNARTCHLSGIGRENLDNIANLGVDLIEIQPNLKIRRELNKLCLETVGDISWAEHVSIFTIPVKVAIDYEIPLILWGENPQNEYGGPNQESNGSRMLDRSWLEEFGGLLGLRVTDLPFSSEDIQLYQYPEQVSGITGVFMGYYFPWDGHENAIKARDHGFKYFSREVQSSGFPYENLDNYQTGIHDFFKFLKYGFGRATDMSCSLIRRGIITREEGKEHALQWDGKFPWLYLDKSLEEILEPLNISIERFKELCEMFTNRDIIKGSILDPRVEYTEK